MMDNNFGKRIGAWITLIALTIVSAFVAAVINTFLSLIVDWTGTLPTFIASVVFHLYWPMLLVGIFVPTMFLINWAANCSESICPTKKGSRYIFFIIWYALVFILNMISLFVGTKFEAGMLLPLIYLWAFWSSYNEYKSK